MQDEALASGSRAVAVPDRSQKVGGDTDASLWAGCHLQKERNQRKKVAQCAVEEWEEYRRNGAIGMMLATLWYIQWTVGGRGISPGWDSPSG